MISVETRAKLSTALMGNKNCLGRIITAETKAKMAASHRGRKHSRRGHRLSAKTRAKIAAANTKYKTSEERLIAWRELARSAAHRARTRKYNAPGIHTAADETEVMRRSGGRCYYCRKKRNLTIDHVVAISNGGSNGKENLVAACVHCNSSKGARQWRIL
jgi:5-methylcytosine-specific restriction endonuclease McrA